MKVRDLEWWIVGLLGVISFTFAIIGFNELFVSAGIERNFLDLMFQSMKIFGMEFVDEFQSPLPWKLEIARWLAPSVIAYAATRAVLHFIWREFKSLRLKGYKDHIIITSLNDKSRFLVNDLLLNDEKVVVVADIENPKKLDQLEKNRAIIVPGDINQTKFLKNIAAHRAKYFVFIDNNDEINISSAITIYQYLSETAKGKEQILFTHVADDIKLNELIELKFFEEQTAKISKNANDKEALNNNCEIRIISMNERAARIMFINYSPDRFTPTTTQDSPQVHIALFGSNDLTQSFILKIARLGHYANFKKVKITLFHEGHYVIKKLEQNFPALFDLVELNSIDKPLELFDINELSAIHKEHNISAAYIMCKEDSLASEILKKLTFFESNKNLDVILTLRNPEGILSKWYDGNLINNINLEKFNLIEKSFTKEALISEALDKQAIIIHNDYLSKLSKPDPVNKATHRIWEMLPVEARNQNREQADHIEVKLRTINCKSELKSTSNSEEFNFEGDNCMIELLSKIEHNRWWASKRLAGWKYAEIENGEKKLHPDLIEYEKLSEPVKDWDRNAVKNIRELLLKNNLVIGKK